MPRPSLRRLSPQDTPWAEQFLADTLGGRLQARRGELVDALAETRAPGDDSGAPTGLVAELDGRTVGLVTWRVEPAGSRPAAGSGREAEITVLAVTPDARGLGVGRALIDAAVDTLRATSVARAWLVTTNDNLVALRLYQRAGWRLAALRPGAVDDARRTLKPQIPLLGDHGIPLHDELELELDLGPDLGLEPIPRADPGA
jgi:ribosomal protein S18 acetylase RimI-like enzyme